MHIDCMLFSQYNQSYVPQYNLVLANIGFLSTMAFLYIIIIYVLCLTYVAKYHIQQVLGALKSLFIILHLFMQVYIRSATGPKGPLTAREIKERVTAEYLEVSIIEFDNIFILTDNTIFFNPNFCDINFLGMIPILVIILELIFTVAYL